MRTTMLFSFASAVFAFGRTSDHQPGHDVSKPDPDVMPPLDCADLSNEGCRGDAAVYPLSKVDASGVFNELPGNGFCRIGSLDDKSAVNTALCVDAYDPEVVLAACFKECEEKNCGCVAVSNNDPGASYSSSAECPKSRCSFAMDAAEYTMGSWGEDSNDNRGYKAYNNKNNNNPVPCTVNTNAQQDCLENARSLYGQTIAECEASLPGWTIDKEGKCANSQDTTKCWLYTDTFPGCTPSPLCADLGKHQGCRGDAAVYPLSKVDASGVFNELPGNGYCRIGSLDDKSAVNTALCVDAYDPEVVLAACFKECEEKNCGCVAVSNNDPGASYSSSAECPKSRCSFAMDAAEYTMGSWGEDSNDNRGYKAYNNKNNNGA